MARSNVVRLDRGNLGSDNAGDEFTGLEGIRMLGHEHGRHYYLSPETEQLVELSAADHTEANLLLLRPLDVWMAAYPAQDRKRSKFDVSKARAELIRACQMKGVFNPDMIRGRGVWWDDAHGAIMHDGLWVRVGEASYTCSSAPGPHIYEAAARWHLLPPDRAEAAMEDDEAGILLTVCERLAWNEPCYARLLAGWITLAPVCAALHWRPHMALTGPREAGKSFVVENIIVPMLGPAGMHVLGDTTAAGIRQRLQRDAMAVVWDEAEPQGAKGSARIQDALALARHLSTAGGGEVVKGGSAHRAHAFSGVAALCLVSIYVQLLRDADASRFTVLELKSRAGLSDPERDRETRRWVEALSPAYAGSFLARTVRLLPILRENHRTFAAAVAARWKSSRLGDQLGGLLAAAALCQSSRPISAEDAAAQVAELPNHLGELQTAMRDEERCLSALVTWQIRLDTAGGKRQVTRSIGELIELVLDRKQHDDDLSDKSEINRALKRYGIVVRVPQEGEGEVAIANHHDNLARIFKDTDFAGGWSRLFERLDGARRSTNPVRFGPGVQVRATALPGRLFLAPEGGSGSIPE